MREDIQFTSGKDLCRGWLYRPEGRDRFPVIVMAHGLGAVKEMRLDAFAERYCASGYGCLVFDYRHFGASEGQPRQLLSIPHQQQDWHAAIAHARSLPCTSGIVLWGSSFSGGHVIEVGSREKDILAVMSQCPFTDGIASALAMDFITSLKVTGRALKDLAAAATGRPPVMIQLAGKPGDTALMTAPDALPGYRALIPEGLQFPEEVAARIGLNIVRYRPGKSAARLRCPVLFCICDKDTVAPARSALKYARQAPVPTIERFPVGHFDIYTGEVFESLVSKQLHFLATHVA